MKINYIKKYRFNKIENFEFPKFENIKVSIVIPVYNQYQLTKDLLFSILQETKNISYEIIIADDNSTDETKNIEQNIKNIITVHNPENLGFLKNVNNAVNFANGKYIMLLNNDMIVTENWLCELVNTIKNDKTIGVVGATVLYPNGKIQEKGNTLYKNGDSKFNDNKKNNNKKDEIKEVDYCSGCCILFSKENWDKIGGFDETFAPAYFEDADFCLQIKYRLNLKIVNQPKSEIYHFHGQTYTSKAKSLFGKNKIKFNNKWNKYLENKQIFIQKYSFWEKIFSIKNINDNKILTILGIKIKLGAKKVS